MARQVESRKLPANRQRCVLACTRRWVRWRPTLEEEKQRVSTQQWWPLSLLTDYRSLTLPQRLPQPVEMNHPSAFFCKPSITSDSAPQTPAHPPPTSLPPPAHLHTHLHRLAHIRRMHRTTPRSGWAVLTNQAEKAPPPLRPPVAACPSNNLPFLSHSFSFLSWQPYFLSSCTPLPSISPPLFLFCDFHSPSPPPAPAPPACISLVGHLPPSQREQIIVDILKGPADEMAHGRGAICSATSASQQTLSFVCGGGNWEDRSAHGDKQTSCL